MSLNNKYKTHSGKLIYNDFGEYELHFSKRCKEGVVNLSELLKTVYYHPENNQAHIKITTHTDKGLRVLFNEEGNILLKRDDYGIYSYHINGECLEEILFLNVDQYIEVEILAKALEGEHYGTKQLCER